MKKLLCPRPWNIGLLILLVLVGASPRAAIAKSPVKIRDFTGSIDLTVPGPKPFRMDGTASHLGRYHCYGEVDFAPGDTPGSLVGEGVAVFEAANGDLLVAAVTWEVDGGEGDLRSSAIHFSWRDAVELSDGTIVPSTGRFVDDRPPGLVVIAIIAILIGLLLPAVQ